MGFYGRTTISIVAMQCVFCVFWQNSDINTGSSDAMRVILWQDNDMNCSDAMRVFYGGTTTSVVAMQCMFCVWQYSDINGSNAVRVFFWPDNDINGSAAVGCVFWQDSDINCSDAMRVFHGRTSIS